MVIVHLRSVTLMEFAVKNWLNENGNEQRTNRKIHTDDNNTELNDIHAKADQKKVSKTSDSEISSLLWTILCTRFTYKAFVTSISLYVWLKQNWILNAHQFWIYWTFHLWLEGGKCRRLDRTMKSPIKLRNLQLLRWCFFAAGLHMETNKFWKWFSIDGNGECETIFEF